MKDKFYKLLETVERNGMTDLVNYMHQMAFEDAPCSGKYHLSRVGGLLEHSLNVYEHMKTLKDALNVEVSEDSLVICSLLHDLGKMGDHDKSNYVENVLKSGKVSEAEPYKTNKDLLYIPHEIRSIAIAERFISLTEEEEHAILFHNGKYTHLGYDLKETPLMMLLHFADLWASRVTESEE